MIINHLPWSFTPTEKIESGYDDIWDDFSKYTSQEFLSSSEERQKEMIEEVFQIYRERNIFPINYYSLEGLKEEIIKCREKDYTKEFNGENMVARPTLGQGILRYLFPSMQNVVCKDTLNNDVLSRFHDDHKLKRAIDYCFKFKKTSKSPTVPTELKGALEMIGGNIATNFLSMRVKMLVDYYMEEGETFFDYSCGFGARLLGVLSSKKCINYIGCEPNTQAYKELQFLGELIEETHNEINRYFILNQGSEVEIPLDDESVDFSFSSPPYFTLERYSNEETQCYNKFPILEDWLEGYVRGTIKNLYRILKKDKFYAVNIADFKLGNNWVHFVDEWVRISLEEGFKFEKEIPIKLGKARPNNLSERNVFEPKAESIYLFRK